MTPIYPTEMKPVRAPFFVGAKYRLGGIWDDGTVYELQLGHRHGEPFILDAVGAAPGFSFNSASGHALGFTLSGIDNFFSVAPRLHDLDADDLAAKLQDVYVPIAEPLVDHRLSLAQQRKRIRDALVESSALFALITGTNPIKVGSGPALVRQRESFLGTVGKFAAVNGIDPYAGEVR